MDRYWIYIDKQIQGPFEEKDLFAVKGFCETSQICVVGEDTWRPARQFPAIRFQLAPEAKKIADMLAPQPILRQQTNVTKVSTSGDYISPDFQFEAPRQRHTLRFRKSTRQPFPGTYRVIPLPQPSMPHVSRGLPILVALISLTSGLWAFGVRPGLPAPVVNWWRSHITIPAPVAPPAHQWRPARLPQPEPPLPVPTQPDKPKHHKSSAHRHHPKRNAASHPKFKNISHKPWFDLRDKSVRPH